jgi:DNA-binding Lrp family transcriptional regulator
MSTRIYELNLPVYEKAVLWFLKEFAQEHEEIFPFYDTIAANCGMSRRKAIYVVKKLVEAGIIDKTHRAKEVNGEIRQDTNVYDYVDVDVYVHVNEIKRDEDYASPAPEIKRSAPDAPYISLLNSIKTEEEEYKYITFKQQVTKYKIPSEMTRRIIQEVPAILTYSPEAIIRTFKKAMNRVRIGGGLFNLPKWFATTIRNEQFYLDLQNIA